MYRVFVRYRNEIKVFTMYEDYDSFLSKKLTELMSDTNFVEIIQIIHMGELVK